MTQTVMLYGGPRHGEVVVLPNDVNWFRVTKQEPVRFQPEEEIFELMPIRVGKYTRVGESQDFEWCGWDDTTQSSTY